jgi:hypothetical protein
MSSIVGEVAIPQDVAVRLLFAAIAGVEPPGGRLELRYRMRGRGGMGQCFHEAERYATLVDTARDLGRRTDVYVGAAPRRRDHGGADAIERVWALWADCDGQDAVEALQTFRPSPTVVVRTGSGPNVHAWWPLRAALTPEQARQANRRLAHRLGADMRATDPARILRVPGTLNFKHDPPVPVECTRLELTPFDALDVVGQLPDPPAAACPSRSTATPVRRHDDDADDALRSIPADVYVPALLGVEPGRDGKIACPFHPDSTPSLHVYDDHWHCYGCDRGGSIIDFGAALYSIEPRGRGYHDIRRRLAAALLA